LANSGFRTLDDDVETATALAQLAVTIADALPREKYPNVLRIGAEATAWKELASAHRWVSRYDAAFRALDAGDRCLDQAPALGFDRAVARFARALVHADLMFRDLQRHYIEAEKLLTESEKVFEEHGDDDRVGQCLLLRGMIEHRRGSLHDARDFFQRAVDAFDGGDDLQSLASSLNNLAHTCVELNDNERAASALYKALSLFVELGATSDIARKQRRTRTHPVQLAALRGST
jgi:tetratricopeptide (TPR) repeat protein